MKTVKTALTGEPAGPSPSFRAGAAIVAGAVAAVAILSFTAGRDREAGPALPDAPSEPEPSRLARTAPTDPSADVDGIGSLIARIEDGDVSAQGVGCLARRIARAAPSVEMTARRVLAARLGAAVARSGALDTLADVDGGLIETADRLAAARAAANAAPALSAEDALQAATLFRETVVGETFLRDHGRRWSEDDLGAAVAWLERESPDRQAEALRQGIIEGWAEADPQTLLEWASASGEARGGTVASAKLCRVLAESDPRAAAEFACDLPSSSARTAAFSHAVSRWAFADREAAASWSLELSEPATRGIALLAVAEAWGRSEPDAAHEWVSSWVTDGDAMLGSIQQTAFRKLVGIAPQGGD